MQLEIEGCENMAAKLGKWTSVMGRGPGQQMFHVKSLG